MIPKKIHYVWFGAKEKPDLAKRCIESWKRFCPDYEIIEWNGSNFDISFNMYINQAYESKKYAFASDLVRLLVVKEHGGIYLDTDVEVVKSFDDMLVYDAFIGFENKEFCNTGQGFGSIPNSKFIDVMIAEYENVSFINNDGSLNMIGCPHKNTAAMKKLGFEINGKNQIVDNIRVLSQEYMNPYEDSTGKLNKTENTCSIHWYAKTWIPKHKVIRSNITRQIRRIFGANCFDFIKRKK